MVGWFIPAQRTGWRVRARKEYILELPLLGAEIPAVWRPRHLRRAARALQREGIKQVLAPPGFDGWPVIMPYGLQPVDTGEFCRSAACQIALAALREAAVPPQTATVVLRGERVTRAMRMSALALCPEVRNLLISAPVGGTALQAELRREFGVPALEDAPARRADVAVHFSPAADNGEQVIDLSGDAPAARQIVFSVAGQELPDGCDALSLLAALWQAGRLKPTEVAVFTSFRT